MASFSTIWLPLALLLSMAVAQVVPSNTSSDQPSGTFQLLATSSMSTIADMVALTNTAANTNMPPPGLTGTLFLTTTATVANLTRNDIAYISCDPADYPGNIDAADLLQQAAGMNTTASVLYSTTSNFCQFDNSPTSITQFIVYSMTNVSDSSKIVGELTPLPPSQHYFVTIVHNSTSGNVTNNQNNPDNNPLGPSPSTAVAMIILYSITGIITALFLIIIVTGAIRAHRNPERYGPRDMMGRPRQSRARGLARAMLDTLPIVKFGEREAPKPTDVELAPTAETCDAAAAANSHEGTIPSSSQEPSEATSAPENNQLHEDSSEQNGISAAEPLPVVDAGAQQGSSSDEGLGCSICTDDFEKGQDIRVLPCNHKFHPACVDPWLLNVSGTCPLCRIDLRPTTSDSLSNRGSQDANPPDFLAPPLEPETEHSHRRRSALRDMLSLRSRPNATTEERLAALRRLRDERRQAEDAPASSSSAANAEEVLDASRRRRMSARLHEVFSVRTRRGTGAVPEGEASSSSGNLSGAASPGASVPSSNIERGPEL